MILEDNVPVLDIKTWPDPVLESPARPVENIDEPLIKLIDDMAETLYEAPGLGLAAVQVGIDKSLLVYDVAEGEDGQRTGLCVLINPKIIAVEGKLVSENEGCLSVPGLRANVNRAACVRVEGLDKEGRPVVLDAEGLLSIVLQHEVDHLNGVLFLDHISRLKREMYKKRVKKMLKEQEEA